MNTPETNPASASGPTSAGGATSSPLPAASTAHPPGGGVSLLGALLLSLACSAISGYASWRFASHAAPAVQVVVFDAEKVATARMEKALASNMSSADAAREGEKFIFDLNTELARYTQAGIVVVNSSVALNRPDGLDITGDVAASLGVQIK